MIIYVYYIYKYIHRWLTSWCVVNNRLVCVVYCPSPSDIRIFFTGYTPPSRYVVFSRFWLEITHMYNITKDIIFVYITYIYIYTRIYITYLYIYILCTINPCTVNYIPLHIHCLLNPMKSPFKSPLKLPSCRISQVESSGSLSKLQRLLELLCWT